MKEYDSVVLTVDVPAHRLKRGDVGVIVHVHDDGAAFIVEFMTFSGDTIAVTTLTSEQLRPVMESELPHVRAVAV